MVRSCVIKDKEKHKGWSLEIGIRIENLYKLEFDGCEALNSKAKSSQTIDVVVEQEQDRALKMEPQPVS